MAQSLPRGFLLGHQDFSDAERRYFIVRAGLGGGRGAGGGGDGALVLPGAQIIVTFKKENPKREYTLNSFAHLMTYAPFRRSMRKIYQMYRKVKRSNCIVKCYLKTTEDALEKMLETCKPCLSFQANTVDAMLWLLMNYIDDLMSNPTDQILPISRNYNSLIQMELHTRWFTIKDFALDSIRNLIEYGLNTLPESWIPEPFMQIPLMEDFGEF